MDILAMSRRIPLLGFFGASASDDDFADRLNYKYTVAILVVFAFVVTNKHFGHNQINCWVPALFSKNFEEYTNLVCWVTNTYYIPFDKQIPNSEPERRHTELKYYQWVAYILLFLALLFYLPRIIWRTLSLRSGVDIKDIIEASHDFKSVSKLEKNRRMMEYMIGTIDQYVGDPRRQHENRHMNFIRRSIALTCFMFGKFLGNYLVVLYLFVKILYIVNCVGQLFLISILLGRNYYVYGASIFKDMIQGKGYADSEYFPRVTMCKFQVRELGLKNFSHEYNVQCVLPINLFNQQIFTFLWFWYLILIVINASALFIWIYRFIPINQYSYAIRRIKLLRIRLVENSKVTKETSSTNLFRGSTNTMISNEMENRAKNYSMNKILNDQDNQFLFDDDREEKDKKEANKFFRYEETSRFQSSQFPNLPKHFSSDNNYFQQSTLNYRTHANRTTSNAFSNSNYDNNQFNMSYINEYDSYMTASSFSVKNYKEFVHEYLEADGMFMLRMVGSNSGDFVCTQVLHNLWKLFLCKKFILKEMKNGKSIAESFKDEKQFTFDLKYETKFDTNRSSDNEEEKKTTKIQKSNKNHKLLTKNYSKKKRFLTRLFSDTTGITHSYNKPIRHVTNRQVSSSSLAGGRTDVLKDSDIRRFQSIKRIPIVKKLKATPQT